MAQFFIFQIINKIYFLVNSDCGVVAHGLKERGGHLTEAEREKQLKLAEKIALAKLDKTGLLRIIVSEIVAERLNKKLFAQEDYEFQILVENNHGAACNKDICIKVLSKHGSSYKFPVGELIEQTVENGRMDVTVYMSRSLPVAKYKTESTDKQIKKNQINK